MRLPKAQKEDLARSLFHASVAWIKREGSPRPGTPKGAPPDAHSLNSQGLLMLYTPPSKDPKSPFFGGGALLDIWGRDGKVFSLWLYADGTVDIVNFRYGPWMNLIVRGSFPETVQICA